MDKSLQEFGQEMARIMPKFIREVLKRLGKGSLQTDVTINQMAILSLLKENTRCKMSDIAKLLSVTTSAATGIVERMVRANLIKRVAHQKDRRVINIEMTEKGRKIIDGIEKARYKMIMDMFSKITPIERKRYLETVKKLHKALAEESK